MKQRLTEKKIYEIYIEIEKELDLFNKTIDDIFFWKLIRFKLYFKILSSFELVKDRQNQKVVRKEQFLRILSVVKNSLLYSTFKNKKEVHTIFFENPRKIKQTKGNYIDPFSSKYIHDYSKRRDNYEIIDLGHNGIHFNEANDTRTYAESFYYDFVNKIKKKFFKQTFLESEQKIILQIETMIFSKFNINLKIKHFIEQKISDFKYQYEKFNNLFQIKKPKEIYLVCSYGKEGMIYAAQSNDIKVVEFQHGVMGKYQLGYSFPENIKVPYFPDKLLMFGQFWSDNTDLPTKQLEIEYVGFDYLTNKLDKFIGIKKQKQVLVISQPGNVDDLIPTAILLAKNNLEYKFIYRLHPKETNNWTDNYPKLVEAIHNLKNFKVDNCKLDLYTQVSKSEFVVGINSAAIFESIILGSKLILVNSSGIEYMNYFIEKNLAIKINRNININLNNLELDYLIDKNYIYKRIDD